MSALLECVTKKSGSLGILKPSSVYTITFESYFTTNFKRRKT